MGKLLSKIIPLAVVLFAVSVNANAQNAGDWNKYEKEVKDLGKSVDLFEGDIRFIDYVPNERNALHIIANYRNLRSAYTKSRKSYWVLKNANGGASAKRALKSNLSRVIYFTNALRENDRKFNFRRENSSRLKVRVGRIDSAAKELMDAVNKVYRQL